jgi:hypothetical protein
MSHEFLIILLQTRVVCSQFAFKVIWYNVNSEDHLGAINSSRLVTSLKSINLQIWVLSAE